MMNDKLNAKIKTSLLEIMHPKHRVDYDPHFWWYFRQCYAARPGDHQQISVQRLVNEAHENFRLARFDPAGKTILDAGCGYGIAALIMHLLGAAETHGIDLNPQMIETFCQYLSYLPEVQEIHPKVGNVSDSGYPDNMFDFVLSNEAISHYYDSSGFIQEAVRIIRPGGILFISDANNGANPYIVWRTRTLWDRFENGPAGDVFYSTVDEPYVQKRQQMIRSTFNGLSESEMAALAQATFGYTKGQILDACAHYVQTGEIPSSYFRRGVTPVDPDNDNYQERLIYPPELVRQLAKAGFKARIYTYLGGAGGNRAIRWLNHGAEIASPLSWPIGRALKVVAIKL